MNATMKAKTLFILAAAAVSAAAEPVYFAQISDTHYGMALHQWRFREALRQIEALPVELKCIIHTGDVASNGFSRNTAAVTNIFNEIKTPYLVIPGNHDFPLRRNNRDARFAEMASLWQSVFGPLGQKHETPEAAFVAVCTESLNQTDAPAIEGFDALEWLEKTLSEIPADKPVFLFTHEPDCRDFYSNRFAPGWSNAEGEKKWREIIAKHSNVKMVSAGHFHRNVYEEHKDGPATFAAPAIASFWGRQAAFRLYRYEDGLLSFQDIYIEDPPPGTHIHRTGVIAAPDEAAGAAPAADQRFRDGAATFFSTDADGIVTRSERGKERALRVWESPDPLELPAIPGGIRPKNIIFIIGDGMGLGARQLASLRCHGRQGALCMDAMPHAALVTTHSANSSVTDSTAAGTALSTGFKTNNKVLGMAVYEEDGVRKTNSVPSIAKLAHDAGRKVGLLTSDYMAAATPAAFYAHQPDRGMTDEIVADLSKSGYEIFYANNATYPNFEKNETLGENLVESMTARGYAFTRTHGDFIRAVRDGVKVVGHVPHDDFGLAAGDARILRDALMATLEAFDGHEEGFFIMAESMNPDHGGHGHEGENALELDTLGTIQCDWMAHAALEYAARHRDTLVIVTADHETGRIFAARGYADEEPSAYHGSGAHTEMPVPLTAYGPGSELFTGVIDNTDIPRLIAFLWNLDLGPRRQ